MEGDRGLYAFEAVFAEGAPGPADGLIAGEGPDDELADHRVVERGDLISLVDRRVHPDAGAAGDFERGDLTWRGHEVLVGVLGVDAKLHRVPDHRHVFLLQAQRFSGSDPDLLLHQVHAGEHLRHGVLYLDARVHLYEVELIALDEKLHGTSVRVPGLPGQPDRGLRHLLSNLRAYAWRRGLLQNLLAAALHRTLALVEVDHVSLVIAYDLHLHVPGRDEQLLQIERPVTEGGLGLAFGHLHGLAKPFLLLGHPDAATPATGRGLHHYRVADPFRRLRRLVSGGDIVGARHYGHLCLPGQPSGG